jgi:hypothetical protein
MVTTVGKKPPTRNLGVCSSLTTVTVTFMAIFFFSLGRSWFVCHKVFEIVVSDILAFAVLTVGVVGVIVAINVILFHLAFDRE